MPLYTTPPIKINSAGNPEIISNAGAAVMNFALGSMNAPAAATQMDLSLNASLVARFGSSQAEIVRDLISDEGFLTVPTAQSLGAAGTQINATDTSFIRLTNTSGGALVLTGTPTIVVNTSPFNGRIIYLVNISANAISLQDEAALAGTRIRLRAAAAALAIPQWDCVALIYSSTDNYYYQVS